MPSSTMVSNHPKDPTLGEREFGLSSSVWVERDDVRLPGTAEKGFKRLEVGACVRLMNLAIVTVTGIDEVDGRIIKVHATATPDAKPRATIHALSREHARPVDVLVPCVMGPDDVPEACLLTHRSMVEPGAMALSETFHAPRVGYAIVDSRDTRRLILTTGLKKGF